MKNLFALLLALVLVLSLTACGGGDDKPGSAPAPGSTVPGSAPAPAEDADGEEAGG